MQPGWKDHRRWAYALVVLATFFWAGNVALGRVLRDNIGPFTLTATRFTMAAIIFSLLMSRRPAGERAVRGQWPQLLAMGLVGVVGFSSLLYTGLRFTTATNAALINGAAPLLIGPGAMLLLKERFSRWGAIGAVLSVSGVATIVSRGSLDALTGLQFNSGDVLMLAAVVAWGLYSIITRVVTRSRTTLSATWLSTLFALPLLYILALWEWGTRPAIITFPVALAIGYICVFPSVVSYLAWNEGVRRVGPGQATAFYNMLPVFGALIGVLLLGEAFGMAQLLGGGLIIAGSLAAVWKDM